MLLRSDIDLSLLFVFLASPTTPTNDNDPNNLRKSHHSPIFFTYPGYSFENWITDQSSDLSNWKMRRSGLFHWYGLFTESDSAFKKLEWYHGPIRRNLYLKLQKVDKCGGARAIREAESVTLRYPCFCYFKHYLRRMEPNFYAEYDSLIN